MAELKTKITNKSVDAFLKKVADEKRRKDAIAINKLMKKVTKLEPKMWGSSIVGFGTYTYKYASGRTGEWMTIGFSPRKKNLTIYIMPGFDIQDIELMKDLGKYKTGKSCLYIQNLEDVDLKVLEKIIDESFKMMNGKVIGTRDE